MQNQSPSTTASQTSSTKALDEASPFSLEELINRTPNITDAEADTIIDYLIAQRQKFATQESTPKPKKSPRQKGPILSADELLNSIDELF